MTLYHVDKRLPDGFRWVPSGTRMLAWSRHADNARHDDQYGIIPKTRSLDLTGTRIIEVETDDDGKVCKVVFRKYFAKGLDVVYVCIPGRVWFVKTVWFNRSNDNHKTLKLSRYAD